MLAVDADVELVAQAELARHGSHLVRPDRQGALVEIDVARGDDGLVQVECAMGLVAVPDPAAPRPGFLADMDGLGIVAVLQRRQGDHGLERRARREGRAQGLVEQRVVVVIVQQLVVGRRNAGDEQVRVKTRARGHAQDFAGLDVHHHRAAGILGENIDGALLDIGVERQDDLLARRRRDRTVVIDADDNALGIDLDPLAARGTTQLLVIGFFDALLADTERGIVQELGGEGRVVIRIFVSQVLG